MKAKILILERRIDEGLAAIGVPAAVKLRPSQASVSLRILKEGRDGLEGSGGLAAPQPLVLFHEWTLGQLAGHLQAEQAALEQRK